MTRFLAFMGRRFYNRVDVAAVALMMTLLSHGHVIAGPLVMVGGLVLSAVCEGAALSKKGGESLT